MTIAQIGGADFGTPPALSAADLATLVGTHTATKSMQTHPGFGTSHDRYQIYWGPTTREDAEDFIDNYECDDESVRPMAAFLDIEHDGSSLNATLTAWFVCATIENAGTVTTGDSMTWEGELPDPVDCEDWTLALTAAGTSVTYSDQLQITLETI